MEVKQKIVDFSVRRYRLVTTVMVVFTIALGSLIPAITVDTDPENMLSEDEPVRVFHNEAKERFALSDIVVVGVVNDKDPNGVFNPASLTKIYELAEFAKTLRWPDKKKPQEQIGVVEVDILALSTVDHISQDSPGQVKFEWLMKAPPTTDEESRRIRERALSNPLLKGTLISEDGKAVCLYLPLSSKDLSYRVYTALARKISEFEGNERYHITGLPVAEDTFGVEMFVQMAVSAPLAMIVIFLLMLLFFRKLILIIAPMIVAMVAVISTMGLLIGSGFSVHIMSSMIPIFLMPIAVVDSVHVLSEFFDLYTNRKGRKDTVREAMANLFTPMLYTSLTSAAGFASLALTPIPPVQVFGIFVAVGIMIAWICTVTFVPAYVMMIPEKSLAGFGHEAVHSEKKNVLIKLLHSAGRFTYRRARPIVILMLILLVAAIYGITRIQINDNPVKWFSKSHPIRLADIELNEHFGGTYMAYLILSSDDKDQVSEEYVSALRKRLAAKTHGLKGDFAAAGDVAPTALDILSQMHKQFESRDLLLENLSSTAAQKADSAAGEAADVWFELADFFELEKERTKPFKQPEVLRYIVRLQEYVKNSGLVGKSSSVADVVRKIHQELIDGKVENYIIPNSPSAVAQCLLQYQSSHNPEDLWHLVTYDYKHANLWLQLTSGDNKDMEQVVAAVDRYFAENPPPVPLKYDWAGLTYINTVWQEKMVWGMLQSFLGSFIIVFIMMTVLFRSPLWGIICMIPLTITIAVIYGIIGLVGKDYDMPVAVLSALTLGMAVDFAIHFLERARTATAQAGSWKGAVVVMFQAPARAITRNVLVIAIGFLPLLAAPLVPYKTVGLFLCAIMALSGAITLTALPAIMKLGEKRLFKPAPKTNTITCNCVFCIVISIAAAILIGVNLHQYWALGWTALAKISVVAVPMMVIICGMMSRRRACKATPNETEEKSSLGGDL